MLSSDSCNSKLPVIAGDLEYEPGLVHILWTDYPVSGEPSYIMYRNFSRRCSQINNADYADKTD